MDETRIKALVEMWRDAALWEFEHGSPEFGKGLDQCADELEAALGAASPEPRCRVQEIRDRLDAVRRAYRDGELHAINSQYLARWNDVEDLLDLLAAAEVRAAALAQELREMKAQGSLGTAAGANAQEPAPRRDA